MDTCPNGHLSEKYLPEWTLARMDTCPNVYLAEWTLARKSLCPICPNEKRKKKLTFNSEK